LLDLLFDSAAETLLTFGREHFGGKVGFTLVLHTWDQRLRGHFHLHGLMPAGALSADGSRWIAGGRGFLFPVHGLSKMFRGKYLDGLADLLVAGRLDLPPQLARLSDEAHRRHWLRWCRKRSWVVYSQAPFAGPRKLVDYLGRYTHRTAIGNQRLISCADGQVTFRYRDRGDGDRVKLETLPAEEFLGRFLQHVLPDSFYRVRHYGLLANCVKKELLVRCRRMLGAGLRRPEEHGPRTAAEWMRHLLGVDVTRCPCCSEPLEREPLPTPRPGPRPHLRTRTVPGVRRLEQFLNRGLWLGHPTWLRDIFKACDPRPRGWSAPAPVPEAAPAASSPLSAGHPRPPPPASHPPPSADPPQIAHS